MPVREGPFWNPIASEYGDILQIQRARQQKPCQGCGRKTSATSGYCMTCRPTLLDEPQQDEQQPGDSQVQPGEPWPEEMF